MHRIEGEGIFPRPRSFYTRHEVMVWGLWVVSIIIGALAVAVMLFGDRLGIGALTRRGTSRVLLDDGPAYMELLTLADMIGVRVVADRA